MVHKPELFKPDWSEHDPDPIYRDYRESKAESRAVFLGEQKLDFQKI